MKKFSRIRYPNRRQRRSAYRHAMIERHGIMWLFRHIYEKRLGKMVLSFDFSVDN